MFCRSSVLIETPVTVFPALWFTTVPVLPCLNSFTGGPAQERQWKNLQNQAMQHKTNLLIAKRKNLMLVREDARKWCKTRFDYFINSWFPHNIFFHLATFQLLLKLDFKVVALIEEILIKRVYFSFLGTNVPGLYEKSSTTEMGASTGTETRHNTLLLK